MLLAITSGEPAGIGPDIILTAHSKGALNDCVVLGDPSLFLQRAQQLSLPVELQCITDPNYAKLEKSALNILPVTASTKVVSGTLSSSNAAYVLQCIEQAVDGCMSGIFNAMVTAPVHKGIINDAGIHFTGHTEFIAKRTQADPVMMLAVDNARVALVTTHLPLSQVSNAIDKATIQKVIRIVDHGLRKHLGIDKPRIAVTGLNPHAGEQGHLGNEEIDTIIPALEELRAEGLSIKGPLPADTLFTGNCFEKMDVAVAMYHDQGLPIIKHIGFGKVVNITLGLPIIRTSVDHGSALDLAGKGTASDESLIAALEYARNLAQNRSND